MGGRAGRPYGRSHDPSTHRSAARRRAARHADRAASRRAGSLDVLLTDAAGGGQRRVHPAALVAPRRRRRPPPAPSAARRASGLGLELARVAAGRSQQAPAQGDRRFARPGLAAELAAAPRDAGLPGGRRHRRRASSPTPLSTGRPSGRRASRRATSSTRLAPTNFPWSNPAVLRAIVDEGGANLVRGGRRFAADVSWPPRLPQSVDTERFEVGRQPRRSPGSVVLRTEVFELIQYKPTTAEVREVPLLFVPPTINKFYVLDLAPGPQHGRVPRRVGPAGVRDLLAQPGRGAGPLRPRHLRRRGARGPRGGRRDHGQGAVHLNAACSGGIITAGALGHLAARVGSATSRA